MLPVRSVLVKQKICDKNQIRYFGWFSNNVKSDIWIQELLQKKKMNAFSVLFFAFALWFMSYFLSFFAVSYKASVTMSLMISWTKNLYFLAGVFWLFFCNFQGQKMLAVAKEAESRVCVVLPEFFHHIDEKAKVLPSKKVVEEVFFVQGYLERPNEG